MAFVYDDADNGDICPACSKVRFKLQTSLNFTYSDITNYLQKCFMYTTILKLILILITKNQYQIKRS